MYHPSSPLHYIVHDGSDSYVKFRENMQVPWRAWPKLSHSRDVFQSADLIKAWMLRIKQF